MPDIPEFDSPLTYLGVTFLLVGVFLVLTGLKIIEVEKISVKPGVKTWLFGIILCGLGLVSLFPDSIGYETPLGTNTPTLTATQEILMTNTPTLVLISPIPEPTVLTATATDTPIVTIDPAQFIRDYYNEINNRNYEQSWSLLSQKFIREVNTTGFSPYAGWWDTVERVDILEIKILEHNSTSSTVYVLLQYTMKDGRVEDSPNTFKLIVDKSGSGWLIDEQ